MRLYSLELLGEARWQQNGGYYTAGSTEELEPHYCDHCGEPCKLVALTDWECKCGAIYDFDGRELQ